MKYISRMIAMSLTIGLVLSVVSLPAYAEVGFGFKGGMLIPDQDPFKDDFDSNYLFGGVLEMDSNMGVTVEASVEYYSQDCSRATPCGKITLFPIVASVKYNFLPRYRTTPFIGLGVGAYFFDREYAGGTSDTKTRFGARVSGGIRFLEDQRMNLVLEAARNFTDFNNTNASSFQVTLSVIFDFTPSSIGF